MLVLLQLPLLEATLRWLPPSLISTLTPHKQPTYLELTQPVKSHHRWLLTGRVRFWLAR
jgi:hypothetical protein